MNQTTPVYAGEEQRIVTTEGVLGGAPRIAGRRIGVLTIYEFVEGRGLDATTVADRFDLSVASVYRALAYYYENPREMETVRRARAAAVEDVRERIAARGRPEGLAGGAVEE